MAAALALAVASDMPAPAPLCGTVNVGTTVADGDVEEVRGDDLARCLVPLDGVLWLVLVVWWWWWLVFGSGSGKMWRGGRRCWTRRYGDGGCFVKYGRSRLELCSVKTK